MIKISVLINISFTKRNSAEKCLIKVLIYKISKMKIRNCAKACKVKRLMKLKKEIMYIIIRKSKN